MHLPVYLFFQPSIHLSSYPNHPRLPSFLKCYTIHSTCHTKRRLNVQNVSETLSFQHFWLRNVLRATTACTFSTSQLPKVLRDRQFLTRFTSKCASRHNAVHFFVLSTSKTAPNPSVFNTFYFQMCFAPQRRALFNISTSKSGPTLRCFVPFHFEIGFAPQRRATFHLSSPQMSPHPPL